MLIRFDAVSDLLLDDRVDLDVPVSGGMLRVVRWGNGPRPVVALHGMTASHALFQPIVRRLDEEVSFFAPDMRGRGASAELPGPHGMRSHVADVVSILDHLELEGVTLVGMSMGGYPAVLAAAEHPQRVNHVVLIDAGLPIAVPDVDDLDRHLEELLGPSIARLEMTFPDRDAVHAFWRAHPSLADDWNEDVEAYIDYDITGEEPELRTRVAPDAIRADSIDIYHVQDELRAALGRLRCPVTLLRATRGVLNEPEPLFPDATVERYGPLIADLRDEIIPDTNHFTIVFGDRPASIVADRIAAAAGP